MTLHTKAFHRARQAGIEVKREAVQAATAPLPILLHSVALYYAVGAIASDSSSSSSMMASLEDVVSFIQGLMHTVDPALVPDYHSKDAASQAAAQPCEHNNSGEHGRKDQTAAAHELGKPASAHPGPLDPRRHPLRQPPETRSFLISATGLG